MRLQPSLQGMLALPTLRFDLDIEAARTTIRALTAAAPPPVIPPGVTVDDRLIPGPAGAPDIPVRLYRPATKAAAPAILYFHGGAFAAGDLDSEQATCLAMAEACAAVIMSIDYRLIPEHPYPAAVEDGYASAIWLAAHAAELGVDPGRLAVAGTSAGGTLAAAVSLMVRDRGGPQLVGQILTAPPLDDRLATLSAETFGALPILTREQMTWMWRTYLDAEDASVSPYAAPGRAADLSGLPPTWLMVGGVDPFRDEVIAYATALQAADVPVELHLYPGAPHAFERAPDAAVAQRARRERLEGALALLHPPESAV